MNLNGGSVSEGQDGTNAVKSILGLAGKDEGIFKQGYGTFSLYLLSPKPSHENSGVL
jgi:hypothetical protein